MPYMVWCSALQPQVTVWNTYILSSPLTPRAQWIKIKGKENKNLPPSLALATFSRSKRSFPVLAEKQIQTVTVRVRAIFNGDPCNVCRGHDLYRLGNPTTSMPLIEVWYILIKSDDNTPFGQPDTVSLTHGEKIIKLIWKIKEGPYKDDLCDINTTDMEVWRFPSLSLKNISSDSSHDVGDFVKGLRFSSGEDSDGKPVTVWTRVMSLEPELQEYEPLIVRVSKLELKGEWYLFLHNILLSSPK